MGNGSGSGSLGWDGAAARGLGTMRKAGFSRKAVVRAEVGGRGRAQDKIKRIHQCIVTKYYI